MSKTYTWQFWLLCLSSLLFFSSFTMIIPELPSYLEEMGGGEWKGLIIALFTVTAGASRPFSGKLADTIGRVPVIMFGAFVCIVCGLIYPFASSVWAFFLLRLVHGMSTGFTPTGTSAYVADIAPIERRGEVIGIQSLCANIGGAMGPSLGSTLTLHYSLDVMFYISAGFALLSVLILLGLKETVPNTQKFRLKLLKISREEVYEGRVLLPATIMILMVYSFGVVLTLIPDLSEHLGMPNKGAFFTYLTIASIFVRLLGSKASDIYGRAPILIGAAICLTIGMGLIAFVQTPAQLIGCAVIFGLAHGTASPTLFAWTMDLGLEKYRGRAMGTTYLALEIGVGSGAFFSGVIYGNQIENLPNAFFLSAGLSFIALIILIAHLQKKKWMKRQAPAPKMAATHAE